MVEAALVVVLKQTESKPNQSPDPTRCSSCCKMLERKMIFLLLLVTVAGTFSDFSVMFSNAAFFFLKPPTLKAKHSNRAPPWKLSSYSTLIFVSQVSLVSGCVNKN